MKLTKNTQLTRVGYKTKEGLGVGIFYNSKGKIVLDETIGKEVTPQHTTMLGTVNSFGSIRAIFKNTKNKVKEN